ncbi:membrane protein [Psychromonas marina]|uniref:Membrane protein n=1 Tax=Psychromonas marina TaxID=88364 RepID=A0ABQ6E3P3_9GAMM|nr:acyltransferase family protein [Psychromonas marina]GLS91956.1 membrane protein [Psychromonas marina]
MATQRPSIFYIDFLRFIAAIAVIAIHVLGPFRYLYGEIPDSDWLAAMGINSVTRWAVPVFMMISGALLLSTERAFNCEHYLTKRLSKVAIPFIGWTIIYAIISGFAAGGWSAEQVMLVIQNSPNDPAWYHLWFFYDFIPLYFVIPFLIPLLKKLTPELVKLLVVVCGLMFLMKWLKVESFLLENLILYTGYLILGWYLFNRDNSAQLKAWLIAGISMLIVNFFGSWELAFKSGQYSSYFMGYKTLNTMIIGGMLFVVAQAYADKITGKLRALISVISKYSLGIYLLHPILLIPVRELDNGFYSFFASNWLAIPIITIIVLFASLCCTMLLAKTPLINRLVP